MENKIKTKGKSLIEILRNGEVRMFFDPRARKQLRGAYTRAEDIIRKSRSGYESYVEKAVLDLSQRKNISSEEAKRQLIKAREKVRYSFLNYQDLVQKGYSEEEAVFFVESGFYQNFPYRQNKDPYENSRIGKELKKKSFPNEYDYVKNSRTNPLLNLIE